MKIALRWQREAIGRGEDPHTGARLTQLTSAVMVSHNVYCEERYGSADGRLVALLRSRTGHRPEDLWLCDLRTNLVAPLADAVQGFPSTPAGTDGLYYVTCAGRCPVLMKADLRTLECEEVTGMAECPHGWYPWTTFYVAPDERHLISNVRIDRHTWGLCRMDLASGRWDTFHVHRDICNPHAQFEPGRGQDILVQLNRGCDIDDQNNIIRLVGDEGATLYLIDRDGGNVRYLPVGKPHTGAVSGHECWIGRTGRILLSTCEAGWNELRVLTPGEPSSRCLWRGIGRTLAFMHVSASTDGNYFVCDDIRDGRIYVGRIDNGRMLALCDSGASCGLPQYTHPHPFLSIDNRVVVFNSDRTGVPQVWAATLPEGFLDVLDVPAGG